jgi:hypothetical protein
MLKRRNIIVALCFLAYIVIVILPPLIYHYVYPNNNDDTATLLLNIGYSFKSPASANYAGYLYLGYPLLWISHLIHTSLYQVWLWFNLLILIPVGFVLYFIGAKLVGWIGGLLMLSIPVFVSGGIMSYQTSGIIFSLILTTVLMLLLTYFVVKYLLEKRVYQFVLVIILTIVASTFHTTGIYIPVVAGLALIGYLGYALFAKHRQYIRVALLLGLSVIIISSVSIILVTPQTVSLTYQSIASIFSKSVVITNQQVAISRSYFMPFWYWLFSFVSLGVMVVLIISVCLLLKQKIRMSNQVKLYSYLLSCWIVVLLALGFTKLPVEHIRAELDASIVIGLIGTLLFAVSLPHIKDKMILGVVGIVLVVSVVGQLRIWFQDNSAVKQADKEAIAYINTLNYANYNCSSTIAYWIYDNLSKIQHSDKEDGLIIMRSVKMTPDSDINGVNYIKHGYVLIPQDVLVKSFVSDGVEVDIYEKQ